MKKLIILATAILIFSIPSFAVPAKRGWLNHTQPDGSVIRIQLFGDEFHHWAVDEQGHYLSQDADGFLRISTKSTAVESVQQSERRSRANMMRAQFRAQGNNMTSGERKILVVLIEFSDLSFKISEPRDAFDRLLNQEGYSDNGGTGSVNQFYKDNSHGIFDPSFDVYGPVKLTNKYSYYGENDSYGYDKRPEVALYDACCLLDASVDFSQYDHDNDGLVDMVLFYYAGYSEAEGASSNTIWPHQYSLLYSSYSQVRNNSFDGKRIANYFCTAELQGVSGARMCGIGTTCHEFAHSIGLPDFYDTDYESHGQAGGMYDFSTMDGGCYLNDSRTPPYFTSEESIMLDWMDREDIVTVKKSGALALDPVNNGVALMTETTMEGEYFLYEFRSGTGWDAYLPAGMVVTHIDKSSRIVDGSSTAFNLWDQWQSSNSINYYGSHPCCYVVPAANQSSLRYKGSLESMVFPGSSNVTQYNPIDWDNNPGTITFSELAVSNGQLVGVITSTEDPGDDPGDDPNPGDDPDPDPDPSLALMGFSSIADPGQGEYSSQEPFKLELLVPSGMKTSRVEWFVDEARVESGKTEINLTPGVHTIMAFVLYRSGTSLEYIELKVNVN